MNREVEGPAEPTADRGDLEHPFWCDGDIDLDPDYDLGLAHCRVLAATDEDIVRVELVSARDPIGSEDASTRLRLVVFGEEVPMTAELDHCLELYRETAVDDALSALNATLHSAPADAPGFARLCALWSWLAATMILLAAVRIADRS